MLKAEIYLEEVPLILLRKDYHGKSKVNTE